MIDPNAVHDALFAGEMFLEYLPTVSLADGRCVGCEALVRWRRGDEIIRPMDFIPIIENTPVSGLLTYWVIDTMGEEMGDWMRRCEDVHVAVNVPPEVLGRGGVEYAGYKANLLSVRNRVVLEITERGAPDRLGLEELKEIAGRDVMIAMDDVAVDENNLLVLSRVPVDVIKVDRHFVANIGTPEADRAMERLEALIAIGRHLVVAEGVETREQAQRLCVLPNKWRWRKAMPPRPTSASAALRAACWAAHSPAQSAYRATPIRKSAR